MKRLRMLSCVALTDTAIYTQYIYIGHTALIMSIMRTIITDMQNEADLVASLVAI